MAGSGRIKPVTVELRPWLDNPEAIACAAAETARAGARVLVLRNTVSAALPTQAALEARLGVDGPHLFRTHGVACPHHSRFAAQDRRRLDEAVEQTFGKASPNRGVALVATQTVEISLDIDADLLITDLAPADVLLQRIGRLHRHARDRPVGFEAARVVVLTPPERDLAAFLKPRPRGRHGLGSVYRNLISVEATWRELDARPTLMIPADNRAVVEAAVDEARLRALAESLGGAWPRHQQDTLGKAGAERGAAAVHALDWSQDWESLRWPSHDERVATRLGQDDRLVRLSAPMPSPFGAAPITELKVPGWMARDVPLEVEIAEVESAGRDEFSFVWGNISFNYNRTGLRRNS